MPTLSAEAARSGAHLLVFLDEARALGRWLLIDPEGVADRGGGADGLPALDPGVGTVLAVPGTDVAIHWLELASDLAPAQAAAAARLMLADAIAAPLADMHIAVGRPEQGLTPAAIVPAAEVERWLALGPDFDVILPEPLLLAPPSEGFLRRDHDEIADWRGTASAFSLEPELAEALTGGAPVLAVDEAEFEADLPAILAAPPLDLRQGRFARRRRWSVERGSLRRIGALALALAALTLVVQIVTLMSYAFAADRAEREAASLSSGGAAAGDAPSAFAPVASILFDAIRSTPNVEVTRLDYRSDGSLSASVLVDVPATLAALRARIEAGGLASEAGEIRTAGGRPAADVTVRRR